MLPKVNRLKKNKDFERVFKKGRLLKVDEISSHLHPSLPSETRVEDFLILKTIPNNLKNSRFGFIVSQKISKKAVLRNKIKRWLRVAVLSHLKRGDKIQKPADMVIIVKPGIDIKNFQEIEQAINKIFYCCLK